LAPGKSTTYYLADVSFVKMLGRILPKAWPQSTKQDEPVLSPVGGCAMLQKIHQHLA
jgi:hypothetical protein